MPQIIQEQGLRDDTVCSECGQDKNFHNQELHDETVNGVEAPISSGERRAGHHHQFDILITQYDYDVTGPSAERERLELAATNANCETHYAAGVLREGDTVVWARTGNRIAGLLVLDARASTGFRLPIDLLAEALRTHYVGGLESKRVFGGVSYVTILPKYRRCGLASALLDTVFTHVGGHWDRLAFKQPFTLKGARLIYDLACKAGRKEIFLY